MPLLHRSKNTPKPKHRLHTSAAMNSFTAKAGAVHKNLAARLALPEAREALGADAAEADRFVAALGVFLKTINP